jgi:DNA-binding MarR family transcriptional regulator
MLAQLPQDARMSNRIRLRKPQSTGCTFLRLRKASRRVSQVYDQALAPFGLTTTQFGLLGHLVHYDGIGIGALAEKLVMDPTTLTRNIRPLERQGYVVPAADPLDRRARRLHITAEGRRAHASAQPAWASAQQHVEEMLGERDALVLNRMLDRVLERLAK